MPRIDGTSVVGYIAWKQRASIRLIVVCVGLHWWARLAGVRILRRIQ